MNAMRDMKIKSNKNLTDNERFFYFLLSHNGFEEKGVKLLNVAKIMAALENEFNKYSNGFAKHFGNDVSDQKELDGKCWQEILMIGRDTFNNGFHKIGITFNSEEEFNQRKNDIDVKTNYFYFRVRTYKRRSFYYRNHSLVDLAIKSYRKLLADSDNSNNQELGLAE